MTHQGDAARRRAAARVNAAVLLFGLSGLFAKWLRLPAVSITFGRVLFSSLALLLYLLVRRAPLRVADRRDRLLLAAAGAVLALHWWSFLAAIKASSVAVGTVAFSSFPLFVTLMEPLAFRTKLRARDVAAALCILLGVCVMAAPLLGGGGRAAGLLPGLLSALTYAVLTLMNRRFVRRYGGTLTAFYEQATAAALLLPAALRAGFAPTGAEWALLAVLGVAATAAAHTLFITGLKELPARAAGLLSSLETVYGILFALILLGEVPSMREVLGAGIILGAVALAQWRPGGRPMKEG